MPNSARKNGSEMSKTHISTKSFESILKTSLHSQPWHASAKDRQSSTAGSSLKQILQVTDDCAETAVGFLDHRTALRVYTAEPTGQELEVGMQGARKTTGCRGSCQVAAQLHQKHSLGIKADLLGQRSVLSEKGYEKLFS